MASFVFQPWNEEKAPASPQHILKQRQVVVNSTIMKASMRSSLKSSINRTADNLKKSVTLEERGITYGKKIESSRPIQQTTQIRRTPKVDCSHGPSEMIQQSAMLLVSSYAEVNPEKNTKTNANIKSPIESPSKNHQEINGKDSKLNGAVPPLNGEISVKKKQANSSAIRQKKYKPKIDFTPYILCIILILLVLSFKNESVKYFVDQTLIPVYKQYFYTRIFE